MAGPTNNIPLRAKGYLERGRGLITTLPLTRTLTLTPTLTLTRTLIQCSRQVRVPMGEGSLAEGLFFFFNIYLFIYFGCTGS